MGAPTSSTLPPPPPRGPAKPSLYDLQYKEQEIRTKLLEAQLMKATHPNAHIRVIGADDGYVWDSAALKWVERTVVQSNRDLKKEG